MHLIEIPEGSNVRIIAQANGNTIEFKSVVKQVLETSILIEEIRTGDGVPVSLASDKITISLQFVNGNKTPILWQDIIVKHVRNSSGSFHQIYQTSDGTNTNRRGSFRLFVGAPAKLKIGGGKELHDVILKDISATGYGFVSDNELNITNYTLCVISSHIDTKSISLSGTLVRKETVEDSSKFVYGCRLTAHSKELEKFIMTKQREQLHRKNQR